MDPRYTEGKLLTAHLAHAGSTVTCYRIVRASLPQSPSPAAENGAGGRDKSPCPPDLMVVTAGQWIGGEGDGGVSGGWDDSWFWAWTL